MIKFKIMTIDEYDNEKGHAGTTMMRTLSSEDMETLQ